MSKAMLAYGLVALLALAYLYPFTRSFSEAPDYGVFLVGADLVNHGAFPSRDFVEPQGPGSFLWLAMFFRIFGTNLETARGVLIATGVGMTLLAIHLSRRLGATGIGAGLFVLTVSIPLMPINSPHYDSNLFALAALAVFLLAWNKTLQGEPPKAWLLVVPAILCGLITWMIQQKGAYLVTSMMACLGFLMRGRSLKPIMLVGSVYGAVVALPFSIFAALHALPDVIYANYIWPLAKYSELNSAPYGFPVWDQLRFSLLKHAGSAALQLEDLTSATPLALAAAFAVAVANRGASYTRTVVSLAAAALLVVSAGVVAWRITSPG